MPVRDTAIGAILPGDPVTASGVNDAAGGCIGYYANESDGIGDTQVTTQFTLAAVPVNSSRLIKVEVIGMIRMSDSGGGFQIRIDMDGTQITRKNFTGHGAQDDVGTLNTGDGKDYTFSVWTIVHSPTAGNHVFSLVTGPSTSAGQTVKLVANAGAPTEMIITDLGADFF